MPHRLALAGLIAGCALLALGHQPALGETNAEKAGVQLAKMLEGRVAGEPEDCILLRPVRRMKVLEGHALVFESGNTLWINTTADPGAIRKWDTFEFRSFGQRLCSYDQVNGRQGPLDLVEFVPWRKIAS